MESLGFDIRQEAVLQTLTDDVVTTSQIESENLDADQVRSSVGRRLGMETAGIAQPDRQVEGVVEMTVNAARDYARPLTADRILGWHAALFPTGRSGMRTVQVGAWRNDSLGPMQVVSGPLGRERVHFEAPSADRLDRETSAFLDWLNATAETDGVLKAALAHLWLVTIHPLDDGNGRVGGALADMLLARSEGTSQRFYSMSAQICLERSDYYGPLERTQKRTMDVTKWMLWFLGCLGRAIDGARVKVAAALRKARVWETARTASLDPRQQRMLNRLLNGFKGKLTTSKWARMAKCSQDTALRDIIALVACGTLDRSDAGGGSTSSAIASRFA